MSSEFLAASETLCADGAFKTDEKMNNQNLQAIVNSSPFGFAHHEIIVDDQNMPIDYRFLEVNPAFERLTGLSAGNIIGKTVREVIPGIEKAEFDWIGFYGKVALEGGNENFEQYSEALNRWYHVSVFSSQKGFFSTSFVDISDRKRTEEQLQQRTAELEKIRQTLTDQGALLAEAMITGAMGAWSFEVAAEQFTFTDEFYAVFRTTAEAEGGYQMSPVQYAERFIPPAFREVVAAEIRTALNSADMDYRRTLDHQAIFVDGSPGWIQVSFRLVRNEDGSPLRIIGVNQDITERKRAEQELQSINKNLEKQTAIANAMAAQAKMASAAKSEFLANMSHEIRTPLNSVIGFTDLLKNTPLNGVQQRYVNNANVSGHTLLGIINDILDFSKIEAGMLELDVVRTDMLELLENSANIVQFSAEQKGLNVTLNIDPAMPRFAHVDPVRLKQILANLLGNAVKFTEKGEVALNVGFKRLEGRQGRFEFSVRDTGIGISDAQKEKLFKAFSQADSSTTRKFGGTGLGLIISDMIAEKMGSRIDFRSTPGVGTTFFLDIVTDVAQDEVAIATRTEPDLTENLESEHHSGERGVNRKAGTIKILVVEDVLMNMALINAVLPSLVRDVEIFEAIDGQQAVEHCKRNTPDLILMDVHMPVLDGMEATRQIRALEATMGGHVPIIALTAGVLKEEMENCFEAGMDDFLTKPIDPEKTKAVLNKHLECRKKSTVGLLEENTEEDAFLGNHLGDHLGYHLEYHFGYNELVEHLFGNMKSIRNLIRIAEKDIPPRIARLHQAFQEKDTEKLQMTVHSLKGMCMNMRFRHMSEIADKMEISLNDSRIEGLEAMLSDLTDEWDIVRNILPQKMN